MARAGIIVAKLVWALAFAGGLGGCSVATLVGADKEAPATHDLRVSGHGGIGRLPVQLTVHEPRAIEALADNRIAVKPAPTEISFFGGAVWADKLPRLLQIRLVEAFEKSHVLNAVGTGGERIRGDFGLSWEVRDFQIEVDGKRGRAHVSVFVKLIDEDAGKLVAAKAFSKSVPARADHIGASVEALQTAFQAVSVDVMRWLVSRRVVVADLRPTSAIPVNAEKP